MKFLSISEASLFLGLSKTTLRRWNTSGYLKPKYRIKEIISSKSVLI